MLAKSRHTQTPSHSVQCCFKHKRPHHDAIKERPQLSSYLILQLYWLRCQQQNCLFVLFCSSSFFGFNSYFGIFGSFGGKKREKLCAEKTIRRTSWVVFTLNASSQVCPSGLRFWYRDWYMLTLDKPCRRRESASCSTQVRAAQKEKNQTKRHSPARSWSLERKLKTPESEKTSFKF